MFFKGRKEEGQQRKASRRKSKKRVLSTDLMREYSSFFKAGGGEVYPVLPACLKSGGAKETIAKEKGGRGGRGRTG